MKILVLNCGSSSLKYQLINMADESAVAKGLVERIGIEGSILVHEPEGKDKVKQTADIKNHSIAIKMVLDALTDANHGVISSLKEIDAVGHRVVNCGENFSGPTLITPEVKKIIKDCFDLAPLHNPANLIGIEACEELMPGVPQVMVLDTAFHQTMPKSSYIYPIPYEAYEKHGVRRYGFHGTSHRYVAEQTAMLMNKDPKDVNIIVCHLGNGGSLSAVKGGKCIDTTMGLTPLEGIAMGTRCGDIDSAILPFLMEKEGMTIEQMMDYLNKKSGVLGVSGVSSDFRDIEEAANSGNERAALALDVFAHTVRKFIGAFAAVLGGVDAIAFTAGLGENSITMRAKICEGLEFFGTAIDPEKNNVRGKNQEISVDGAKVKVFVVPTNEELIIARDTKAVCSK
ncbi:acetate kinase [Selenomonadales bacterium OttesenSCG-928-I06]|nr:acetate kinase [Selenomonadales bacterium OttesenSCG-928-I06]